MGEQAGANHPAVSRAGNNVPTGPVVSAQLAELVARHHATLYRYAFRLAGNQADACDLTQQAFLLAQERISQLREFEAALGWLQTILRNCFLKGRQRENRLPTIAHDVDCLPVAESEESFDSEKLQAALRSLSDEFRAIVLMFYFENLSYKEIASELEIPLGTVMSRLARAKQMLKTKLASRLALRPAAAVNE